MGISQEVFTYYGWHCEANVAFNSWAELIDYELPEEVLIMGMDSTHVMVGVKVFESGDARWEPLEGFESFTESGCEKALLDWMLEEEELYTMLLITFPELKHKPRFYTFVNYS